MHRIILLLTFTSVALSQNPHCLPGQKPCGKTCCGSQSVCCPQTSSGCAPPNTICCPSEPKGYCDAGQPCCRNGCGPVNSTCCGPTTCKTSEECCIGKGDNYKCYDPMSDTACCLGVDVYDKTKSTCCNDPPKNSNQNVCPGKISCCYQRYRDGCWNPLNSTCCPSVEYPPLSFVVDGEKRTCCGDENIDYACTAKNQVCCPAQNKVNPGLKKTVVRKQVSSTKSSLSSYDPGQCANASSDFCCPYSEFSMNKGDYFKNSIPCPLGDLCCPGGKDDTGVMRAGGCCYGQPAAKWKCGINGAPVCPCGYQGYPECKH
eukprot:m.11178 g.11178  ORF g.11178 m.11178 type:complete len:316 (+) comp4390_c0_seq1:58-1005(+)